MRANQGPKQPLLSGKKDQETHSSNIGSYCIGLASALILLSAAAIWDGIRLKEQGWIIAGGIVGGISLAWCVGITFITCKNTPQAESTLNAQPGSAV